MNSVVIVLASNERYFPGLYCAVASALGHWDAVRKVDLKVLDGGMSRTSRDTLSRLIDRVGEFVRLEFVAVDPSVFRKATLGPGQSHMTYYRLLLPHLLDVPRVIYLDCDVLVFRDVSELFDLELSRGKVIGAVPDSETLTLGDDSLTAAAAMKLPSREAYFNAGVMLMNLDELRKQNFTEQSLEFFKNWRGHYRFHDQSAFNVLLYGRIDALPEYWNRASWQFDEQDDNNLSCVLHYTRSAPWLRETPGPAQALFEQFASHAGLAVNRRTTEFKHSQHQWFWRNALAPLRAAAFFMESILYKIFRRRKKTADYQRAARYWFNYVRNAPSRRRLHRTRIAEIQNMKFNI
jgi:lipopolysaccharide biosynthesis glycosyltransferase